MFLETHRAHSSLIDERDHHRTSQDLHRAGKQATDSSVGAKWTKIL